MLVRRVTPTDAPTHIRKQDLRLRGMLAVSELDERARCLPELVFPSLLSERQRFAVRQQNSRALRIFARPKLECRRIRACRGVKRVERHRAISRFAEGESGAFGI